MAFLPNKIDDEIASEDDGFTLRNCGYGIALIVCYVSLVLAVGAAISARF